MAEKLVFGDTNHLFALIVASIPIVLFYLVRHLAGVRWAWGVTLGFIVMLAGNLSFLQYIANAKLGYGEALAGGFFLLGLTLLLRAQPGWGGGDRSLPTVTLAGASLAAAMFLRPNFAIAVVWLGAAYALAAAWRRDYAAVGAVATGLACALWMPFHNWYFGGEFHLISGSRSIAMPIGAGDYAQALGDLLRGQLATQAVTTASSQLGGWLWNPGFIVRPELAPLAWATHLVKLGALLLTCWVVVRWGTRRSAEMSPIAVVAVAALCANAPMLFVFHTHYRYAMLGWDLTLLVLIAWVARTVRLSEARSAPARVEPAQVY